MNGIQLISHPATNLPRVGALLLDLSLTGAGDLRARFDCRCRAGALRLPQARPAQAADELWRHTCCELFVGVAGDPGYREFNCSPSGQWAMYGFSAYREREPSPFQPTVPAPSIEFASEAGGWTLQVRIAAAALPRAAAAQIELGVAVVLEAEQGSLSYWALRHAAERPDFHRRETFVLRLSEIAQEAG
ncbi:MAG: DOMON-like domain-containing protein [Burkholderiales bacterium]|nr:DOMON-like domain-containing protein [Burkholderiales bacterium]